MQRKLVVLMVVVALLVAACAPGAPAAAPSGEQPATGKITLRLWSHQNTAFIQANEAIIAKFMEQNPDIEVKYEQFAYDQFIQALQTSMQAGTEADVIEMFGTWVCSYAEGGRLAEMPMNIMSYAEAEELFFEAPLNGYYCDGKLYGLPNEFNLEVGGALVNPALFEGKDVAYPPVWNDMDTLREQASRLAEFDGDTMVRAGFNFVGGDGLPFLLLQGILEQGGSYFAEDGVHFNFDTPEAVATIQLLTDMVQKDKVVDPILFNAASNDPWGSFFAGNAAASFIGSWAAGAGRVDYPDLAFDYVNTPPLFGSEYNFAADSGWGKVVSANSRNQEAAWKLVEFMTAEQANALAFNTTTGTIPALKALVENPEALLADAPWVEPTLKLLPHGHYIGDLTDRDKLFYEIIYPAVLQSLQGSMTPEQAAQTIHAQANEMVDAAP